MSEFTKETIKKSIESNKKAIKSAKPKIALQENPHLLIEDQKKAEIAINNILNDIINQYNELLPFVKRLRDRVSDITEETHFCAVYLLLCQAMTLWESLFLLAKNGKSPAVQAVLRTIKESTALATLFSLEFDKMEDKHLKKWFSGEIVDHSAYRKAMKEFYDIMNEGEIVDMNSVSRDIYQIESQYTHVGYGTVMECISPFTEDFDFEKYTGFRRTSYNLGYAKGAMDGTNIALKYLYRFLLRDSNSCNQLEKILIKYDKSS